MNQLPSTFSIGPRLVGAGQPCFVIAEIAQAHDGSLGTAHAYIDAVARAGVDAVKFQTHIAAAESTPGEPFRVPFSKQDASRYDYWKRMEFSEEQWRGLATHATERGLIFLSSAFSLEAFELLSRLGMAAWKVGSGELGTIPLLERMASSGRPILLSSGMSTLDELDEAVRCIQRARPGIAAGLFQCTTAYPCPPEKLGLNVLEVFRRRYGCPVGLSDHSGTPYAGIAAATLGANLLEVHVVFSRDCFGPDVPASVTIDELAEMTRGIRFIEKALAHPVEKDAMAGQLADLKRLFGKSIVAARPLPAGKRLEWADLAIKKPGGGLPPGRLSELIGRKIRRALSTDNALTEDNLD